MAESKRRVRKNGAKTVQFRSATKAKVDKEIDGAVSGFAKEMQVKMIMDRFYQYIATCVGYKDMSIQDIFTARTLPLNDLSIGNMSKVTTALTGMIVGMLPRVLSDPTNETRKEILWMLDEVIFATQVVNLAEYTGNENIYKTAVIVYASAVVRVTYMTNEEADTFLAPVKALVPELTEEVLNDFSVSCFGKENTEERFAKNRTPLRNEVAKKYKVLFEAVELPKSEQPENTDGTGTQQ